MRDVGWEVGGKLSEKRDAIIIRKDKHRRHQYTIQRWAINTAKSITLKINH